jgi:hypothetical protein
MLEKMGFDKLNEDHREVTCCWGVRTGDTKFFFCLQNLSKQQLKTHFIKDENRIFPNEQEITVYLQQQHHEDLFQIQHRKNSIILIF